MATANNLFTTVKGLKTAPQLPQSAFYQAECYYYAALGVASQQAPTRVQFGPGIKRFSFSPGVEVKAEERPTVDITISNSDPEYYPGVDKGEDAPTGSLQAYLRIKDPYNHLKFPEGDAIEQPEGTYYYSGFARLEWRQYENEQFLSIEFDFSDFCQTYKLLPVEVNVSARGGSYVGIGERN